MACLISEQFDRWQRECNERFNRLKANEEELNRIFIEIYGLQDELTPDVEEKDVTVRRADLGRDVRSLISYVVGCLFGRYSPEKPGLILAGQGVSFEDYCRQLTGNHELCVSKSRKITESFKINSEESFERMRQIMSMSMSYFYEYVTQEGRKYTFYADEDNIIPICDDEYFMDDIVRLFVNFIEAVYGKSALAENLKFIADALGGTGQPEEVIRRYFLNDFYADHLKIYQKRPIYWLFDSGKKNGFKALIYMHRYQPDTIARLRTDYVHEQQARYRTLLADLERRIETAAGAERVKLTKRQAALRAQSDEIQAYEEKIHHLADQMISIDLDDGVKQNYALFESVLAKIK